MDWTAKRIAAAFGDAGLGELPFASFERFRLYLELLVRWNERIGLTAIRAPEDIVRRHFIECAFAAQNLPDGIATLLDFGSGAGFPGIPIAICRPAIRVTLGEAQLKKAAFLEEAIRVLGITTEVFARRVDTMPTGRDFDAVTLRAVDKMKRAILSAAPLARRFLVLFTTEQARAGDEHVAVGFAWQPPMRLPYSTQSLLLIGARDLPYVPRGTSREQ